MQFGWEGEKVRLVPLDRQKHFDNCVRWFNDPAVTRFTLMGDFPLTRVAEEDFFERCSRPTESATDLVFAIETLADVEEHIGVCGMHNISFRHGTATTGTLIGRPQLWGKGYGSDAVRIRTRFAFEVLGLRLLLSEVMAENVASLHVLAKSGYREVGRIPKRWWKRGAYRDVVLLAAHRDALAAETRTPPAASAPARRARRKTTERR